MLFSGVDFGFVATWLEGDLLGGDDLFLRIVEGADGFHLGGDASTEEFGEVLGGEEVADIFVKAFVSTEACDVILDKVGVSFLVVSAFGFCEEDIFDEAFYFNVTWSDTVFETCLLNIEAVGDEAVRCVLVGLQELGHLTNDCAGAELLVIDDGFTEVMASEDARLAR